MPGATLSDKEMELARLWRSENVPPSQIAQRLRRAKSTINRMFAMKSTRKVKPGQQKGRRGPARKLTDVQVTSRVIPKMEALIKSANVEKEVTMHAIKRSARVKVSERKLRQRLQEHGVKWYSMRSKPTLTEEDVKDRKAFAEACAHHPKTWWKRNLHLVHDVKFFPVYLHGKARRHVSQTGTRGCYRKKGQALMQGYFKPNPRLKYNTGAKGVHVLAGVGNGKVLLWEYIDGRWNADEAARIYSGPMKDALAAEYPGRKNFTVLEDNDSTGYRSKKAIQAKKDANIAVFEIPRHSPELNICDYWLWKQVSSKMRQQEKGWPAGKKESRDAYLRRLKRTAMSMTEQEVDDALGSMKRRCQALKDAEGGPIEG